jgi:hypothetical protein
MAGCGVCRGQGHTHLTLRRPHHGLLQSSNRFVNIRVTDPRCLSRIPDPDLYPSRISDPGSNKRGGGKFICPIFYCRHKYHKIDNYFILEQVKKKNLSQLSKNYSYFLPNKLSLSSQKYGFVIQVLRSEIRNLEKTHSGSWTQGSKRHRIQDPNPQHWLIFARKRERIKGRDTTVGAEVYAAAAEK